MRKILFSPVSLIVIVCLLFAGARNSFGQTATVKGYVKDASIQESLPGVNVVADSLTGTATDGQGYYELKLDTGWHFISFSYIGYVDAEIYIHLREVKDYEHNEFLISKAVEINTVVISASRYEQRLSDVTVSMEVIPADFIESTNTYKLDEAIGKMPGVDVIDGQANIRGGSGYSYGAGSRVMVLVDDLPMLSGDVNDVKWSTLPVESISQVEIVKGASSALYGSSALNGVINMRTASPGEFPSTTVEVSAGMYLKPKREEMAWWWDHNPLLGNVQFSHLRKAGPVDIAVGAAGVYDEGYRQDNYERYGRINAGLRYSPEKAKGLSVGFNANVQYQDQSDFLIWTDADSGAWIPNPDAVTPVHGTRFNIDPYAVYFDRHDGRHSLKTRLFSVSNKFDDDPDKDNGSDYYFAEYQYHRQFRGGLHLSAGAAGSYTKGKSNLYGNHFGSTMAGYAQLDRKFFNRLSISLGLRWEGYTLDRTDKESRPVARAGINWQAAEYTFVRASFGQGYRYPSMAEKYTATSLGALNILPNPGLKPETGWSTEAGIRQGLVLGSWNGYLDLAGFYNEYNNMIEFIFGNYTPDSLPPSLDWVGFKSVNTGKARISGLDASVSGSGKAGPVLIGFFAGYTYMNPLDLSADTTGVDTASHQILKYRYRHSAKGDLSADWKKFDAGITIVYTSFIERIDPAFEDPIFGTGGPVVFPGLKDYRAEHDNGTVITDLRLGWQFTPSSKISFLVKNLFNAEAMGRPGDIQPPRTIFLQYLLKL